jgi:hypothetical protein
LKGLSRRLAQYADHHAQPGRRARGPCERMYAGRTSRGTARRSTPIRVIRIPAACACSQAGRAPPVQASHTWAATRPEPIAVGCSFAPRCTYAVEHCSKRPG